MWKAIDGCRWPYRVSDQGVVQKQLKSGAWQTIKPYPYHGQMRVWMWVDAEHCKKVQVAKLVADAFLGGTPPGMCRVHRNGLKSDNAMENILFLSKTEAGRRQRPGNCRPVAKVDRNGEIVAFYASQNEAARKNHLSQQAVSRRCRGLVEDPYRLDGYNYVFD